MLVFGGPKKCNYVMLLVLATFFVSNHSKFSMNTLSAIRLTLIYNVSVYKVYKSFLPK